MAATSLSLDELVAVNEELAALARAGVPLESTLGELGRDVPGRLGRAMTELASHIERGESLPQAFAAMSDQFPPLYVTAVEAGIRAGQLPAVLEDLATNARKFSELRRSVALAALYPFLVVLIAYSMFWFFAEKLASPLSAAFEGHEPLLLKLLHSIGESSGQWGPIGSLLLMVLFAIWQYRMLRGRATLRWVPVAGKMLRNSKLASFSGVLALLVRHDVPLGRALTLAGESSGDHRLETSANELAIEIERGMHAGNQSTEKDSMGNLPSFFLWLVHTGHRKELLVPLLEQSAETYRRAALREADWIGFYLPLLLTVGIGGVVVLCYAVSLFLPLTQLLQNAATDNILTW